MRRERWMTRKGIDAQREAIARAGSVRAWIRAAGKRKPLTGDERARHAAANAVADKFGFPRPYPDLDDYPRAEAEP